MTADVALIGLVNVLMLLFGIGLLPLLRIAGTPRELAARSPVAYGLGMAATGILGSTLELLRVPLGLVELAVLALAGLIGGGLRLFAERRPDPAPPVRSSPLLLGIGLVSVGLSLALILRAAHAYAVRPLREHDGWVIWATKARALYDHGGVRDDVFASAAYDHPDYPLLLPTLEAIGFRALGGFDGTLLHLQLAGLAVAFAGAAWTISRASASPAVAGLTILAVVSSPAVLTQLGWNYADIPVAMMCAIGVSALAAWLLAGETWLLTAATVFLAAAALTKSEGMLFSLSAFVAILVVLLVEQRSRVRAALVALGAFIALILPWRLYVLINDLHPSDYEFSNLASPSYLADASHRVRPAIGELLYQMRSLDNWGLLLPIVAFALITAVIRGRYGVASFAGLWFALSFTGLILIYWISELPLYPNLFNTSYRTIATLMIGSALLVPPLLGRRGSRGAGDI